MISLSNKQLKRKVRECGAPGREEDAQHERTRRECGALSGLSIVTYLTVRGLDV